MKLLQTFNTKVYSSIFFILFTRSTYPYPLDAVDIFLPFSTHVILCLLLYYFVVFVLADAQAKSDSNSLTLLTFYVL